MVAAALTVAAASAHAQVTVTITPAQDTAATAPVQGNGVVLCGSGGTANPSCGNVPRPRSRLFEGIELTKAQQDSVDAITSRYRPLYAEIGAQRSALQMTLPVYHAQFLGLRARERAEKRKVLTAEQQPRFDVNADSVRKADERIMAESRKVAEERQKQGGGPAKP